jgi:hypothetical protein
MVRARRMPPWWVRRGTATVLLACLGACTLDTSGLGSGSDAIPGGDDDGASTAGGTELEPSTSVGSGQAEGDTTAAGGTDEPASSGSVDDGDTTGSPVDPCETPAPFTVEIDVTDALLTAPMQLGTSPTEGSFAYSEVANQGRASFQFQVPCQAEFRAWARVYDPGVGASALDFSDPDSFTVAFDGEADTEWWYGCQMVDAAFIGGAWSWEPLMDNAWCANDEFRRTLSPGTHLLHLGNREAGDLGIASVAAVAHVVVTSDPAYAP